tara:strand:+ start:848 stop:1282 length:435 start_codon:yes stop_codon:yes gene_type:complete
MRINKMKSLKQYIKEEIIKLSERQFPIPPKILDVLKNKLKMDPLIRYVENLKAVNSIPPSYRVFLVNGESFDLIDEDFSLLIKIGSKEYFLNDIDEKNYAIQHINRLLTGSKIKPEDEEDEEGEGDDIGEDLPPLPELPEEPEL